MILFVEGAKEGFDSRTNHSVLGCLPCRHCRIPYFGSDGFPCGGIGYVVGLCGWIPVFVGALPTALMKVSAVAVPMG